MTVNHNDILGTALRLSVSSDVDGAPCESDLRSVASRAYYASFHAALDAIPDALQPSKEQHRGRNSHQVVIDAVVIWGKSNRPGRTEARIVARNLAQLKGVRKKADYFTNEDFTSHEALNALHLAAKTIASAALAAEQTRRQVS